LLDLEHDGWRDWLLWAQALAEHTDKHLAGDVGLGEHGRRTQGGLSDSLPVLPGRHGFLAEAGRFSGAVAQRCPLARVGQMLFLYYCVGGDAGFPPGAVGADSGVVAGPRPGHQEGRKGPEVRVPPSGQKRLPISAAPVASPAGLKIM
jgi:hypothetical protein